MKEKLICDIDMFKSYRDLEGTEVHSNIFCFPPENVEPTIIIGGTSILTFAIPFPLEDDYLTSVKVLFKKEATFDLVFNEHELDIEEWENKHGFTISLTLTPENTLLFREMPLLDTFVQIQFNYKEDIFLSDKLKVKVVDTLVKELYEEEE